MPRSPTARWMSSSWDRCCPLGAALSSCPGGDFCLVGGDTAGPGTTTRGVAENGYAKPMRSPAGCVGSEDEYGSRSAKVLRGWLAHLGRRHGRGGLDVAAAPSGG